MTDTQKQDQTFDSRGTDAGTLYHPAGKTPAQLWQELYEGFYQTTPGCFLETIRPRILELDLERREILLAYDTTEWMRNPMGHVHGGILAAMADTAEGILSKALIDALDGSPTVHLSMNYLRPVGVNRTLHVRAVCNKRGAFLNYLRCAGFYPEAPEEELFNSEGVYFSYRKPGKMTLPAP